jgi:hypothetical protein
VQRSVEKLKEKPQKKRSYAHSAVWIAAGGVVFLSLAVSGAAIAALSLACDAVCPNL